jgi:hypothetical protein
MNKYAFVSEKKAISMEMKVALEKYSETVCEFYLANGFDALAVSLKLDSDFQRRVLFDFIMLDKKILLECIKRNKQFFLKMISDGKGEMIRPMLGLKAKKYNQIWKEALDLLNLYFVERKVDEKLFNLAMEKFFQNSILNELRRKKEN